MEGRDMKCGHGAEKGTVSLAQMALSETLGRSKGYESIES